MADKNHRPEDRDSNELWRDFHRTARDESAQNPLMRLPEDRDELAHFVGEALRAKFDGQITVDDDGDFVLRHMDQTVWVHVHRTSPTVVIMARVGHGVYSRRATEVELGILNRDSLFTKWTLVNRAVWQESALPGLPFCPAHLDTFLDQFLIAMSGTRDDLAYRTGAKVA